ncbi:MAG: methylated-DNA--[protein]-cysteine S-methyltransferase [Chthoniobacterales bacterium]
MAATSKDLIFLMLKTAHGLLRVVISGKGLARVEFCPKKSLLKNSPENVGSVAAEWIQEIRNRAAGKSPKMKLPLDLHGTPFQKAVWRALCKIPHGEVRSYQEIAESIGKPRAVRAVANACGANRIGILVPCHRVIHKDGKLGGYYWGPKRKRQLLEQEGVLLPLTSS